MSHRRLATSAAAAVLGVSLVAAASPAQAASWQTLDTHEDARLQACKVPTDSGFTVKLRVRNANGFWVKGQATALESGNTTNRSWSSGRVDAGDTSPVGTVRVGRGDRWELSHSLSSRAAGGGGLVRVTDLGRC